MKLPVAPTCLEGDQLDLRAYATHKNHGTGRDALLDDTCLSSWLRRRTRVFNRKPFYIGGSARDHYMIAVKVLVMGGAVAAAKAPRSRKGWQPDNPLVERAFSFRSEEGLLRLRDSQQIGDISLAQALHEAIGVVSAAATSVAFTTQSSRERKDSQKPEGVRVLQQHVQGARDQDTLRAAACKLQKAVRAWRRFQDRVRDKGRRNPTAPPTRIIIADGVSHYDKHGWPALVEEFCCSKYFDPEEDLATQNARIRLHLSRALAE